MLKGAFIEAWKKFRFYLVIPDLAIILFSLIFLLYFTSFSKLTGDSLSLNNIISLTVSSFPDFSAFISENILKIIVTLSIFVFLNYFLGSGILAMKYGLFKDAISDKKFNSKTFFKYGKDYLMRVFLLRLYVGIIATLIFSASILFFLAIQDFTETRISVLLSILLLIFLIAIMRLTMLFRYASMYLNNKNSWNSLKESFNLLKEKPLFLIAVFIIITVTGFLLNGLGIILNYPIELAFTGNLLFILQGITGIVFYLAFVVWADLFIFILYSRAKS